MRLDALTADVLVTLAPGRTLEVRLEGGGVRPHQSGELALNLEARLGETQQLGLKGTFSLAQLAQGQWRSLGFAGAASVAAPRFIVPRQSVLTMVPVRPRLL